MLSLLLSCDSAQRMGMGMRLRRMCLANSSLAPFFTVLFLSLFHILSLPLLFAEPPSQLPQPQAKSSMLPFTTTYGHSDGVCYSNASTILGRMALFPHNTTHRSILPHQHHQASEYGASHTKLPMTTVYMYRFICFCTVYGDNSIPTLSQHKAGFNITSLPFITEDPLTTVYKYRVICFCTDYGASFTAPYLFEHNQASEYGASHTKFSMTTVYMYRFICFCTVYGDNSIPSLPQDQAGFNLTSLPFIIEDPLTTVYKYRVICFCTDYGASFTTPSLFEHNQTNGSNLCISQHRMRIGEVHSLDGLLCPEPLNQQQMRQNPSHGSLASSKQILLTTITIIVLIVSFMMFFNRSAIPQYYDSNGPSGPLPDLTNVLHQEESPNQAMWQNFSTRSDLPDPRRRHTIDACIYNLSPLRITDYRIVNAEENAPPAQLQKLPKRRPWRRVWRTVRGRCCFPTSSCFHPSPTVE